MTDDESRVRELLEAAGPREELPEDDLDAIRAAARVAWRAKVAERAEPREVPPLAPLADQAPARPWWRRPALAAAAALVVVAGLAAWWWAGTPGGTASVEADAVVAHVEAVSGFAERAVGDAVRAGEPIDAGEARLSLRLDSGAELRVDRGSRLRIAAGDAIDLERGAVYADTGAGAGESGGTLAVRTPFGVARDIGTRFSVRLAERAVEVRVREGAVELASHRATAGEELRLAADGTLRRSAVAPHGPVWEWVMDAAPPFTIEGRTVREMLDRVARETGWRVRYADDGVAALADEAILHGSVGGLRADQVALAVLPSAGLEGELSDGVLTVRRAAP